MDLCLYTSMPVCPYTCDTSTLRARERIYRKQVVYTHVMYIWYIYSIYIVLYSAMVVWWYGDGNGDMTIWR